MAIQYAGGTIVSTTFIGDTRGNIALNIRNQLINAGWTLVRTNSTNNFVLESDTTPSGLSMRLQVYDPNTGVCARLRAMTSNEQFFQNFDCHLLPGASKTYQIIANRYQFFVFTPGNSAPREFVAGGVPWIPPFLEGNIFHLCWIMGNSYSDTDTGPRASFRHKLHAGYGDGGSYPSNQWACINGESMFQNASFASGPGMIMIVSYSDPYKLQYDSCQRWHDDSHILCEPLIGWGRNSYNDTGEIIGQLWDSYCIAVSQDFDASFIIDGTRFQSITGGNTITGGSDCHGSLLVATTSPLV